MSPRFASRITGARVFIFGMMTESAFSPSRPYPSKKAMLILKQAACCAVWLASVETNLWALSCMVSSCSIRWGWTIPMHNRDWMACTRFDSFENVPIISMTIMLLHSLKNVFYASEYPWRCCIFAVWYRWCSKGVGMNWGTIVAIILIVFAWMRFGSAPDLTGLISLLGFGCTQSRRIYSVLPLGAINIPVSSLQRFMETIAKDQRIVVVDRVKRMSAQHKHPDGVTQGVTIFRKQV